MASSKSGVAHVTGDAMAVYPQHGEKSTSPLMSISTTEPIETIDTTSECFFTSCSVYVNMISPLLPADQWFIVNIIFCQTLGRSAV